MADGGFGAEADKGVAEFLLFFVAFSDDEHKVADAGENSGGGHLIADPIDARVLQSGGAFCPAALYGVARRLGVCNPRMVVLSGSPV
jgi:hypothetical protein